MDERHKNLLQHNHVLLCGQVDPRGTVLDSLYEDGIFTDNDVEEIDSARTQRDRCQALLYMLPTRGPQAFEAFKTALDKEHLTHLVEKLTVVNKGSIGNESKGPQQECTRMSRCKKCETFWNKVDQKLKRKNRTYTDFLENFSFLLLHNVEPKYIIGQLFQDGIVTVDDIEIINNGVTRWKKTEILLKILDCQPPKFAIKSLVIALRKKYQYIVDAIEADGQVGICEDTIRPSSKVNNSGAESCLTDRDLPQPDIPVRKSTACIAKADIACARANSGDSTQTLTFRHLQYFSDRTLNKISRNVSSFQTRGHSKKTLTAFNFLSGLINEGEYLKFDKVSMEIQSRYPGNENMHYLTEYMEINRYLFQSDFERAKKHIKTISKLLPKTDDPRYATLEMLSTKTRMYLLQRKLGKLKTLLNDAKMIIESDPNSCSGRAAGWIYLNDGRFIAAQMACLNLSKTNAMVTYNNLFNQANGSFKRSMEHFKMEQGNDGPFGFAYAQTRLAILLLRCGDNGRTMGLIQPTSGDIDFAESCLKNIDESDVPIVKILKINYCLAKCDYMFRRSCTTVAKEHAQIAYDLASELDIREFMDHANNRLLYMARYHSTTTKVRELSEDEVNKILFQDTESSEHVDDSSSTT